MVIRVPKTGRPFWCSSRDVRCDAIKDSLGTYSVWYLNWFFGNIL
jgi:hypothetical protein